MAQVVASLEQALLHQQESPIISASGDDSIGAQSTTEGTLESLLVLDEGAMRPPKEDVTSKSTQEDPDSLTRGKDYSPFRKWGWPWKAIWNKGKPMKISGKKQIAGLSFLEELLPVYSYETLAKATNNFRVENMLGNGGFGSVYKGVLLNGQEIAVKKLSYSTTLGIEFMDKIEVASTLQHQNIVRLLGCCAERGLQMLIYEYMPNQTLDAYLFDSKKRGILDWSRRAIIIKGIGNGLLYLHQDSRLKIIHRDLKASKILLDKELNPKISDIVLARILEGNQDEDKTWRIVGTLGYMAPEYAIQGIYSEKSDVYSYGVLLLEIVSGKRSMGFFFDDERNLIKYAWKLWSENQPMELVDPALCNPDIEIEIQRYVQVGLLCVQDSSKDRPNMSTVISMLNAEVAELPRPKFPSYCEYSVNDLSITTLQGR